MLYAKIFYILQFLLTTSFGNWVEIQYSLPKYSASPHSEYSTHPFILTWNSSLCTRLHSFSLLCSVNIPHLSWVIWPFYAIHLRRTEMCCAFSHLIKYQELSWVSIYLQLFSIVLHLQKKKSSKKYYLSLPSVFSFFQLSLKAFATSLLDPVLWLNWFHMTMTFNWCFLHYLIC